MRNLLLLGLLALVTGVSTAAEVTTGTMNVTFGWIRQADGTKKSVKGMKFPLQLTRIAASRFDPIQRFTQQRGFQSLRGPALKGPWGQVGAMAADMTIYSCDTGSYGIFDEFGNPSTLDDVNVISSGIGKVWNKITFGFDYAGSGSHVFLVRWRIWDDKINTPTPGNDFGTELADFGGLVEAPDHGTWKVEVGGVEAGGMACQDQQIYVAQQLRLPQLDGEGAFDGAMQNVFNNTVATIGSSEDLFYFDSNTDGNYEDPDELEQLSEGVGNLLYVFKVNSTSTTTTCTPTSVTPVKGRYVSGDYISLWFNQDANTYLMRSSPPSVGQKPISQIEATSVVPGSNLLSIRIVTRAKSSSPNTTQKIEIWRYQVNPQWVTLETKTMPWNQFTNSDIGYGGTIPKSQFVGPGNAVKMRLTFTSATNAQHNATIDQVNWLISRG